MLTFVTVEHLDHPARSARLSGRSDERGGKSEGLKVKDLKIGKGIKEKYNQTE